MFRLTRRSTINSPAEKFELMTSRLRGRGVFEALIEDPKWSGTKEREREREEVAEETSEKNEQME